MNQTIKLQLNHKSIRKFKTDAIPQEIIDTLVSVAQHTATSNYAQSYSIISVTDPIKKKRLAEIGCQPYIEDAAHIFIMIADQARNAAIVKEELEDTIIFSSFDKFFIAATDAILAAQNIIIAAESLGIGGVLLGSILNQIDQLNELFEIPKFAVPVLGIALGYPDQSPQAKPRLPKHLIHFENIYPKWENISLELSEYDKIVTDYYSARSTNKRIDTFAKMITNWSLNTYQGRIKMLEYIQSKDLIKY
ncbi:NADPH-dependent oxidoreductase [Haploplasma axanthum]|uniref:Putative NADPH-dependent oxidoreductase n=1 Tax=Haploplasma axanthum TaxID=29552 RepID=A0A449BDQ5_HAPAX|nr:NADPH-dependent oxidoreductase [Haploplasma axanthum]VEU80576.1 putative NADPH-dependent oxidoreductase [Haploplasma axanthum]